MTQKNIFKIDLCVCQMSFALETLPKIKWPGGTREESTLLSGGDRRHDLPVVDPFDSQDLLGTHFVIGKVIIQEL